MNLRINISSSSLIDLSSRYGGALRTVGIKQREPRQSQVLHHNLTMIIMKINDLLTKTPHDIFFGTSLAVQQL